MADRRILLAGDNFGSGSSREHAPWALVAWGIRAILSTGFADIFRSNALKNGLLPITVEPGRHRQLFELSSADPNAELTVELDSQVVHLPGDEDLPFEVDPIDSGVPPLGEPKMVFAHPGQADVHPVSVVKLEVAVSGRRAALTAVWWSGI